MAKIKIQKKDIWIDMTPMSDVMTLLLCFFMLTSTFLTPEPVSVTAPNSVSELKIPEQDVLNILVTPEGKVFCGTENKNNMQAMLDQMTDKFGIQLNAEQIKHFREDAMVGASMSQLGNYLNLDPEKMGEAIQKLGLPLDSINGGKSEFQEWVTAARDANPDIKLAIKCDSKTPYSAIKLLMSELQDMSENRFQLITNRYPRELHADGRHDDASDHLLHAVYYTGQAAGYAVDHAVKRRHITVERRAEAGNEGLSHHYPLSGKQRQGMVHSWTAQLRRSLMRERDFLW